MWVPAGFGGTPVRYAAHPSRLMTGSFVESASGLLIPGAERTSKCVGCDEEIPASQIEGHVVECVKSHRDQLAAEAAERREDLFEHDEERYQWMRQRGSHG